MKCEGWKIIEKVCMSLQAKRRFFISISVKKITNFSPRTELFKVTNILHKIRYKYKRLTHEVIFFS